MKTLNNKAIIFDFMRTLYDPESGELIPGAYKLLEYCSRKNDCYLVSHKEGQRQNLFEKLDIEKFFIEIKLVERKDIPGFRDLVKAKKYHVVYIVGDRIDGEIRIGNKLKFTTIWFRFGKFMNEIPRNVGEEPDYVVTNLIEIKEILKKS